MHSLSSRPLRRDKWGPWWKKKTWTSVFAKWHWQQSASSQRRADKWVWGPAETAGSLVLLKGNNSLWGNPFWWPWLPWPPSDVWYLNKEMSTLVFTQTASFCSLWKPLAKPQERWRGVDPKRVAQTQILLAAAAWQEASAGCHEWLSNVCSQVNYTEEKQSHSAACSAWKLQVRWFEWLLLFKIINRVFVQRVRIMCCLLELSATQGCFVITKVTSLCSLFHSQV